MPGIGLLPAGYGSAGIDPVTAILSPFGTRTPRSLAWDWQTRDYARDSDGRFAGGHPVDTKVFYLLRTPRGSVKSNPDIGETISAIRYIDPLRIRAEVEDRVKLALADPLSKGEIELGRIDIDTRVRGRLAIVVHYINLVTASANKVPIALPMAA